LKGFAVDKIFRIYQIHVEFEINEINRANFFHFERHEASILLLINNTSRNDKKLLCSDCRNDNGLYLLR